MCRYKELFFGQQVYNTFIYMCNMYVDSRVQFINLSFLNDLQSSIHPSIFPSFPLAIFTSSIHLSFFILPSFHLDFQLSSYLYNLLSIYLVIFTIFYPSIQLSLQSSIHLSFFITIHPSFHFDFQLSSYLYNLLSIYLAVSSYSSIFPSFPLSICPSCYLSNSIENNQF